MRVSGIGLAGLGWKSGSAVLSMYRLGRGKLQSWLKTLEISHVPSFLLPLGLSSLARSQGMIQG
jgi:hypothetical protein